MRPHTDPQFRPERSYTRNGVTFTPTYEFRCAEPQEWFLSDVGIPLQNHSRDRRWRAKRHILREVAPGAEGLVRTAATPEGAARTATHVTGEVRPATPPLRRIDVHAVSPGKTDTATVGFIRTGKGPGIRLELSDRLTRSTQGPTRHKDRYVVANKMLPEAARRIGQALIDAALAAESDAFEYSKKSS